MTTSTPGNSGPIQRSRGHAHFRSACDDSVAGPGPYASEGEHSVQVNPAAQTRWDGRFDCADNRPLTADELRTYWRLIEKLPGLRCKCLRLLTDGQRIEQLVRLRSAGVRADSIAIYDTEHHP